MGFLKKLFGSKDKHRLQTEDVEVPLTDSANVPPELTVALEYMQSGNFKAAIESAEHYANSDCIKVKSDANRICALSFSRLDLYARAFEHYLMLFSIEESAHTALQLATTSVMAREPDRGEAWLIKFDQINEYTRDVAQGVSRANFITALTTQGYYREAFPHVCWLKNAYKHVRSTDSHVLFVAGLPFFSVMMEKSLEILQATLSSNEIDEWYLDLALSLDKEGAALIQDFLTARNTLN